MLFRSTIVPACKSIAGLASVPVLVTRISRMPGADNSVCTLAGAMTRFQSADAVKGRADNVATNVFKDLFIGLLRLFGVRPA